MALQPGWYELASHVERGEARRLIELLARAVPGVEAVVECAWEELDAVVLGPSTLVFVAVPEAVTHEAIVARLKAHAVRLGVYQQAGVGRWPEVAWDEIEVKGPLVASLRKSLVAAEHPLAHVGIGSLPIELLAGATSEPIELLALVEGTVELALRHRGHRDTIAWPDCALQAIGRRLAQRLRGVAEPGAVLACLANATDGTLDRVAHPREVEQLGRRGLAHVHEGDASLVPLARFGADSVVMDVLDHDLGSATRTTPSPAMTQSRARSPDEAFETFDPRIGVRLGDPWYVDLCDYDPEVARIYRMVGLYLRRRDRGFVVMVSREPGSGANVMLQARARELEADGLVTLMVHRLRAPTQPFHVDGSVVVSLLRYVASKRGELVISDAVLGTLATVLSAHTGVFADASNLAQLADLLDEALEVGGSERRDPVLHACGWETLVQLQRQLAARGQQLCLYIRYEDTSPNTLPVFPTTGPDVHVLLSVSPPNATQVWGRDIISLRYPTHMNLEALTAILSARADLDAVFEQPKEAIHRLLDLAEGNLGLALGIAHIACSWTNRAKLSVADLEEAVENHWEQLQKLRQSAG